MAWSATYQWGVDTIAVGQGAVAPSALAPYYTPLDNQNEAHRHRSYCDCRCWWNAYYQRFFCERGRHYGSRDEYERGRPYYNEQDATDEEINKPKNGAEAASEKTAKEIAKQIERDLGKDARREFHDMKESGAGDRTLEQLKEDARDIYNEANKPIPGWLK